MSHNLATIASTGRYNIHVKITTELHDHLDVEALKTQLHELADMLDQQWADHEAHRHGLNGDPE